MINDKVEKNISSTYSGYKQQHEQFVNHASSNIDQQQAQLDQLQQQIKELRSAANQGPGFSGGSTNQSSGRKSRWDRTAAAPSNQGGQGKGQTPPMPMVDLSRPPPGFGLGSVEQERPSAPYYDLPAGLMVPLVKTFFS